MIGIIVTYHGEIDYIRDALDSIIAQTIPPQAVVVVNDAHPTSIYDLVKSYGFDYVRNANNLGLAGARNVGIAYLQTPFYLPLDADDILAPECIESYLHYIADHGEENFYYSNIFLHQAGGISYWKSKAFDITSLLRYNYISATSCVPRAAWELVGGYDSDFSKFGGWEDWAFWLNLYRHGITGIHVPEALFYRRVHPESMTKKIDKAKQIVLRMLLQAKFSDLYEEANAKKT